MARPGDREAGLLRGRPQGCRFRRTLGESWLQRDMVQGNHVRYLAEGPGARTSLRHFGEGSRLDSYGRPKSRWRLLVPGWIWLYYFHRLCGSSPNVAYRL